MQVPESGQICANQRGAIVFQNEQYSDVDMDPRRGGSECGGARRRR